MSFDRDRDDFDMFEHADEEHNGERFRRTLDKEKLQKRRKKNPGMKTSDSGR